jgi:hypothetical protein
MRPFSLEALDLVSADRPPRRKRGGKRLATIVVLSGVLLLTLATPVVALG